MDFKRIVLERYAVKQFDGKKVVQEKIDELLEMVRLAPSSWNLQPWKIKVVSDEEMKKKLAPAAWDQPQVMSCSHLLVFCADTDIFGKIEKLEKLMLANNVPAGTVTNLGSMMRDSFKSMSKEQQVSWAQRQVYLALENALLGAKALGFDSCPMEGFSGEEYAKILKLPSTVVPIALCAVGYATDKARPKVRFPKEEIVI